MGHWLLSPPVHLIRLRQLRLQLGEMSCGRDAARPRACVFVCAGGQVTWQHPVALTSLHGRSCSSQSVFVFAEGAAYHPHKRRQSGTCHTHTHTQARQAAGGRGVALRTRRCGPISCRRHGAGGTARVRREPRKKTHHHKFRGYVAVLRGIHLK
jgi:hypothetical protein